MFSFATKIVKKLALYPQPILAASIILAILCIVPVSNLRWELQLQDTISSGAANNVDYHEIEDAFGGLGSLTVVLKSPDSLLSYNTARDLARHLQNDSLVHFLEYETDIDFYKKNSLLYIQPDDLDTIAQRLDELKRKITLKNNPLFVDLNDTSANATTPETRDSSVSVAEVADSSAASEADSGKIFDLNDMEEKYLKILLRSHASDDGKIHVVDIYPKKPLSDLAASRALLSKVSDFLENRNDVEVFYTGKVYNTVLTGRALLPEAKFAGKITALFILLLFIIHFYRQPQLILVSALPASLPILYTLALASVIYGRINLFTLLLALFLPGQACQIITHVLNRYFIERNNNLGPQLSIESAVLGIGPSTAASACIMSGLFLALYIVPVSGLQELGVLGAIGSLLNWGLSILLTTALLQLFQRKKPFTVNAFRFQREYKFKLLSYRANKIFIAIVSAISLVGFFYGSKDLRFFYDFKQTEIVHEASAVDTLLEQTGFPHYDPIIVMLPNQAAGDDLYRNFQELQKKKKIPNIDRIYTLAQFSPKKQVETKHKLENIQKILTRRFLQELDSADQHYVTKLNESLNRIDFDENETPEDIRLKFSDNKGNAGVFAYIFPNINPDDGLECRHLQTDLKKFEGIENGTFKITGTPVLRATFLDMILKNIDKSLAVGAIFIWFFLLLYYNRFSRAIFTLLPSLFAMGWLVFLLRIFGIEISAYSSLAFPILFAFSVDGSLQLWTAYYEKQGGTALNILQRKFFTVGISQMASLIGTYGLLISSHPGLRSIGQICLLGLVCISVSQFTIFPLIAGSLDSYRLHRQKKSK